MKKTFFLLLFAGFMLASSGQTMEVGLFGGLSYYLGELNPGIHFLTPKPAYGALARVNFNPRLAVKASVYRGKVIANDYKGKRIIVVSHGGLTNSILFTISDGEFGSFKTRQKNCCINKLELKNDEWKVEFYNKTTEELNHK